MGKVSQGVFCTSATKSDPIRGEVGVGAVEPLATLLRNGTDGEKQQAALALRNLATNQPGHRAAMTQLGVVALLRLDYTMGWALLQVAG